jgi:hypothetical protein
LQAFDPQTASVLRLDTIEPRGTELFVQPYTVLLYSGRPALGYRTYEELFRGRTVASLTYFQVSLPALDARQYARSGNALAQALASTMRLPSLEEERQGIYRAAIAAILGALGRDEMDEDAAAALWALVHTYLPYRIERANEVDVEWSEEDVTLVQKLDQKWLADIRAEGRLEGALHAKRAWLKEDIARRFGALPPEVAARIDGVESEDQLDAIKRRLDTATALDELFM